MENQENPQFREYRNELAEKIKSMPKEERPKSLAEAQATEEYQTAEQLHSQTRYFKRLIADNGFGKSTPENLDLLTGLLTNKNGVDSKNLTTFNYQELVDYAVAKGLIDNEEIATYGVERKNKSRACAERIDKLLTGEVELPKKLRSHQEIALVALKEFFTNGYQRGYIAHPTGAGKTVLFSSLIKALDAKTLIVVPSKTLVEQTYQELTDYLPSAEVTHLSSLTTPGKKNRDETRELTVKGSHGQAVITTYQSLIKRKEELAQAGFEIIVLDEAHNSFTPNVQDSLRLLPEAIKLGLTATPEYLYTKKVKENYKPVPVNGEILYADPDKSADTYYPHEIHRIELKEAIEAGMLAPVAAAVVRIEINLDDIDLKTTKNGLDFNEKALNEKLSREWSVIEQAVKNVLINPDQEGIKDIQNRQLFVATGTIEQANKINKLLNGLGIPSEVVIGQTSDKERGKIFERYKNKKTRALCSVQALKEGWDAPEAEVCLMLRPTTSRIFYQQIIGRVLRLDPNNPEKTALIVDFLGNYQKHQVMSTPFLFDKKKFYNGEILIPPTSTDPEQQSRRPDEPALVEPSLKTKVIEIETVEPVKESSKGTVVRNGEIFMTKGQIMLEFNIRPEIIADVIDKQALKPLEGSGKNYFNIEQILSVLTERNSAQPTELHSRFLSLRSLSQASGLKDGYVRSLIKYYNLPYLVKWGSSGGKPYQYHAHERDEVLMLLTKHSQDKLHAIRILSTDAINSPEQINQFLEQIEGNETILVRMFSEQIEDVLSKQLDKLNLFALSRLEKFCEENELIQAGEEIKKIIQDKVANDPRQKTLQIIHRDGIKKSLEGWLNYSGDPNDVTNIDYLTRQDWQLIKNLNAEHLNDLFHYAPREIAYLLINKNEFRYLFNNINELQDPKLKEKIWQAVNNSASCAVWMPHWQAIPINLRQEFALTALQEIQNKSERVGELSPGDYKILKKIQISLPQPNEQIEAYLSQHGETRLELELADFKDMDDREKKEWLTKIVAKGQATELQHLGRDNLSNLLPLIPELDETTKPPVIKVGLYNNIPGYLELACNEKITLKTTVQRVMRNAEGKFSGVIITKQAGIFIPRSLLKKPDQPNIGDHIKVQIIPSKRGGFIGKEV
ncbi:MAG: hypothetical protein A3H70_03080 [Candidatus Komeilibacteria bacterium RIFCSPLOWO2_02_FULL_48_11]|uniref:Helicase ATP-binding domain-containing protein n=1 Tax=Candidatus Komeilibacteria bacterium RIFCSPLOWO2_02_FULL_48_11 TaxID=1798553 RepID=A0A1G2BSS2_9BACT|nr:MAG: hypothetical protein A3H70_03080 [Candidatus Komeilibacteria bacterium RIFCSPLOWO2_02_FULL_48_11]